MIWYNDPVRKPKEICETHDNEKYCEKRYQDDGLVRFTVETAEEKNCCVIQRAIVVPDASPREFIEQKVNYRTKVCTLQKALEVDCSRFHRTIASSSGRGAVIDQYILAPESNTVSSMEEG